MKYHPEIICGYNFILVDETHRIYPKHYDEICDLVMRDNKICIFSSDPEQVLSSAEKRNGIVQKINSLPLIDKYELSEKIRTNKELASFYYFRSKSKEETSYSYGLWKCNIIICKQL